MNYQQLLAHGKQQFENCEATVEGIQEVYEEITILMDESEEQGIITFEEYCELEMELGF